MVLPPGSLIYPVFFEIRAVRRFECSWWSYHRIVLSTRCSLRSDKLGQQKTKTQNFNVWRKIRPDAKCTSLKHSTALVGLVLYTLMLSMPCLVANMLGGPTAKGVSPPRHSLRSERLTKQIMVSTYLSSIVVGGPTIGKSYLPGVL